MKATACRALLLAAGSLLFATSVRAEGAAAGEDGGLGILLLIGFLVWMASGARKNEAVRCPACHFRAPRHEFSGGRCPRCGSQEDVFR